MYVSDIHICIYTNPDTSCHCLQSPRAHWVPRLLFWLLVHLRLLPLHDLIRALLRTLDDLHPKYPATFFWHAPSVVTFCRSLSSYHHKLIIHHDLDSITNLDSTLTHQNTSIFLPRSRKQKTATPKGLFSYPRFTPTCLGVSKNRGYPKMDGKK